MKKYIALLILLTAAAVYAIPPMPPVNGLNDAANVNILGGNAVFNNANVTGNLYASANSITGLRDDSANNDSIAYINSNGSVVSLGIGSGLLLSGGSLSVSGLTAAQVAGYTGWHEINMSNINQTPASTSQIITANDLSSIVKKYTPLKITANGTTVYAMANVVTSNTIDIAGCPLYANITALSWGDSSKARQLTIPVGGNYEDMSSNNVIANKAGYTFYWMLEAAKIVFVRALSNTHDSGATHGTVTVYAGSNNVLTSNLTISADNTTVDSLVNINPDNYTIAGGDILECGVEAGSNGDAANLTLTIVAIQP